MLRNADNKLNFNGVKYLKKGFLKRIIFLFAAVIIVAAGVIMYGNLNVNTDNAHIESDKPQNKETVVTPTAVIKDENDYLSSEQKAVLQQYALLYAQTLATLEPQDISGLYYDLQSSEYYINKTAFEVLVTVRNMSDRDLKLEQCSVTYNITDAYTSNGKTYVSVLEDNSQKFKFIDDVSQSFIIQHQFVMEQQEERWYIKSHAHEEDFYLLTEEAWEKFSGSPETVSQNVIDAVIADTQENIDWLQQNYLNKTEEKTATDTNYDRQAAVSYANSWVGERNYTGVYLAYDAFGGNCQNFASQCLYAGGLNMDHKGYSQWKFYSKTLNEYATAQGRSYSWTGVEPFFNYCRDNTSGGIVAHTDWGIAYTQKGDVIQVGAMGQWRHSVFVTDVIYDENGYADEIIIASNTADRISYPLSAYIYTAPRLIHIVGQN